MFRYLFPFALIIAAAGAEAGTFTPPEGCTGYLTVQSRGCRVSNHYKCSADAPGDKWRADFDQEGVFFVSRIDNETQWVESIDVSTPNVRQTLDANPEDPASFTELQSSGTDTFAFGLSKDNGVRTQVRGFDRLTGKGIVIDGISLAQTEFEFTETDPSGSILRQSKGNEYIHREWRMFFAGPSQWSEGGADYVPVDGSPLKFIFPGEPGFFSSQPLFECDAVMSQRNLPQGVVPAAYLPGVQYGE